MDLAAQIYADGTIVDPDPDMELSILELGVHLNNPRCMHKLASFIENHDTEYDKGVVRKLEIDAAEAGLSDAQLCAYLDLRDVHPDDAAYWLRRAAVGGDLYAIMALANEYELGEIVSKSNSLAIKWYERAYDMGEYAVKDDLDRLLYESDPFDKPDYSDIDTEKMMALEEGEICAFSYIGDHYMDEKNKDFDIEIGMKWYSRGANLGDATCKDRLAFISYYGLAADVDEYSAFGYASEAAYEGCPGSQYILGMCYLKGLVTGKDMHKARLWLERAADNGYEVAKKALESLGPAEEEAIRGLSALFA